MTKVIQAAGGQTIYNQTLLAVTAASPYRKMNGSLRSFSGIGPKAMMAAHCGG